MRAILIAVAALMAVSIPAQAQVDHVGTLTGPSSPACVTTLHLDEAYALINARRPVNKDFCLMLQGGTEVVKVQSFGSDWQVAYQVDDGTVAGKTLMLFMKQIALANEMEERRLYGLKVKQEAEERNRKQWADLEWSSRANDDLKALIFKHNDCVLVYSTSNPICKGIEGAISDLRLEIISRPKH